jgi:hypothetical protein
MIMLMRISMIALLLITAQSCAAGAKNRETVALTGTVAVVGNEPFTHVILTVGEGKKDYLITGPLTDELRRHHQGETISLEGSNCTPPSPQFTHCFKPTKITILDPQK